MPGDVGCQVAPPGNDLFLCVRLRPGTATALLQLGVGVLCVSVAHVFDPVEQDVSCNRISAKLITENVLINIDKHF